jgi:hypothetical protein
VFTAISVKRQAPPTLIDWRDAVIFANDSAGEMNGPGAFGGSAQASPSLHPVAQ